MVIPAARQNTDGYCSLCLMAALQGQQNTSIKTSVPFSRRWEKNGTRVISRHSTSKALWWMLLLDGLSWSMQSPVRHSPAFGLAEEAPLRVGPPPALSNAPEPKELEQMLHIARKFDVAGRDALNRILGRAGKERGLRHERAVLKSHGRNDPASEIRRISEEEGDGAGFDIASFTPEGEERLIEVKTTNGWERTPFHMTRNELAVAEKRRKNWYLFRVYHFSREPRAFELRPPLDRHMRLIPTTCLARFPES